MGNRTCKYCGDSFSKPATLRNHVESQHSCEEINSNDIPNVESRAPIHDAMKSMTSSKISNPPSLDNNLRKLKTLTKHKSRNLISTLQKMYGTRRPDSSISRASAKRPDEHAHTQSTNDSDNDITTSSSEDKDSMTASSEDNDSMTSSSKGNESVTSSLEEEALPNRKRRCSPAEINCARWPKHCPAPIPIMGCNLRKHNQNDIKWETW